MIPPFFNNFLTLYHNNGIVSSILQVTLIFSIKLIEKLNSTPKYKDIKITFAILIVEITSLKSYDLSEMPLGEVHMNKHRHLHKTESDSI